MEFYYRYLIAVNMRQFAEQRGYDYTSNYIHIAVVIVMTVLTLGLGWRFGIRNRRDRFSIEWRGADGITRLIRFVSDVNPRTRSWSLKAGAWIDRDGMRKSTSIDIVGRTPIKTIAAQISSLLQQAHAQLIAIGPEALTTTTPITKPAV